MTSDVRTIYVHAPVESLTSCIGKSVPLTLDGHPSGFARLLAVREDPGDRVHVRYVHEEVPRAVTACAGCGKRITSRFVSDICLECARVGVRLPRRQFIAGE